MCVALYFHHESGKPLQEAQEEQLHLTSCPLFPFSLALCPSSKTLCFYKFTLNTFASHLYICKLYQYIKCSWNYSFFMPRCVHDKL